jgi:hypothetical protein
MFEIDSKLQTVLIIFIIINFGVYYYKPQICFDSNGNLKEFGSGETKTIFPFWLITLVISLLIYVYVCVQKDDFV